MPVRSASHLRSQQRSDFDKWSSGEREATRGRICFLLLFFTVELETVFFTGEDELKTLKT